MYNESVKNAETLKIMNELLHKPEYNSTRKYS